jgi:hypothetical protein
MNRRFTILGALFAALFLGDCQTASARQIVNGDFEGGTYNQTFGGSTDVLPNGWSNSPPTNSSKVNVFANGSGPGSAENGTHYLAFESPVTDGTQDCLNQTLSTIAGHQYTISFWVALTPSTGSQFGLAPEWDSGGANYTIMGTNAFYYHPNNSPAVPYTFFSFTETASSNSTLVYFHGADATGAVLLDNVTFAPVPEPTSLVLVGLTATVGYWGRRLRRRNKLT